MSETQVALSDRGNGGMTTRGLRFESFNDLWKFCGVLARTDFVPPGWTPEKCLVAIQFGMEVGLTPMQALQNVGVVNGKPFLYGDAPLALCRQSPDWDGSTFREWTEGAGDKFTAYCQVGRRHEEPITQSFSWAQAKEAGLTGKDLWKKYPVRMLQFKPRQWALRDKFGDVLKGLLIEEEAREIAESNGNGAPRRDLEARMVHPVMEVPAEQPARKALPPAREPVSTLPPATAEPTRVSGTAWTADQIADGALRPVDPTKPVRDRDTIIRLRTYLPRLKEHELSWKDFVKGDPHTKTDEQLEAIMLRMENAITDAFFEKAQLPEIKDPGKVPEREPGADDDQGEAGAAVLKT